MRVQCCIIQYYTRTDSMKTKSVLFLSSVCSLHPRDTFLTSLQLLSAVWRSLNILEILFMSNTT